MFEIALRVILCICQITTISAIFFKIFAPIKMGQKFWSFMQRHKVVSAIYIIMTAIGLFGTIVLAII